MDLNFLGMFLLLAPLTGAAELLPNGGAELGIMYMSSVTPVSTDFFTGRYCFKLDATDKWKPIQPWHPVKVEPGKKYTFSAWVRSADEPCEAGLAVRFPEEPGSRKPLMRNKEIGTTWTRISGTLTVPDGIHYVLPRIPVICRSGKGTLFMDDFSVNAPETELKTAEVDHEADLAEDAQQGHDLDKAYYEAGTRLDVIVMDFDELKKQGKTVPDGLYDKVKNASDELRKEWWIICLEREKYWLEYSRAKEEIPSILPFREKIADFAARAKAAADALEKECAALRAGLVFCRPERPKDPWKNRFVLAADYDFPKWGVGSLVYPGRVVNIEYEAKTANRLKLDYCTILLHPLADEELRKYFLDGFDRYAKMPYLIWSNDTSFEFGKNDMVTEPYFNEREKLSVDLGKFLDKYKDRPGFAGVQIDEPVVRDNRIGDKLDKAWQEYLESRAEYLKANHVENPKETVEWDIFKGKFMGGHIRFMRDEIKDRNFWASACVMPTYEGQAPSRSPYVGCCAGLDQAGTDLYRNGSTLEGLHMQLFKHALGKGRAILLPGSMFSCKTPDNYCRSISNGIVHADGLHMWTHIHWSKYRDANSYWRWGGKRPTLDDRRRLDRYNWYPWGYDVMRERYDFASRHAEVLADRESLADVALVVSERVRFLNAKSMSYWRTCHSAYGELVGINVPFDAIFIENLTDEHLKRYKVIVAPGLTAMTPEERSRMEKFVSDGGCLVTTDDFGTLDEWGRPLETPVTVGERLPAEKAYYGALEDNLSFAYRLRQDIRDKIREAVEAHSKPAYSVVGLPFGVEVALQKSATGNILIHTLDFVGGREVSGHRLRDNSTGKETPLPTFRIHGMTVLQPK